MRRLGMVVAGTALAVLVFAWAEASTALVFTDVPDGHPYAHAINDLAQLGIVSGKDDGTFGPDDPLLRAQFAKMMCGLLGLSVSEDEGYAPFVDLGPDAQDDLYPHEFVGTAYRAGITKGKTATTFAPYTSITLAQVTTMVVRAADARYPGLLATPPADWHGRWADTDPTHGASMRRADYAGLLALLPVDPPRTDVSQPATRGEVSQILANLLQKTDGSSQHCFQFAHFVVDSQGPNAIWLKTVGDLDGDGRTDLLAGGYDSGGLVWYKNPSWAEHVIAEEGNFRTDAEVGDVDKDGDNDVVALTATGLIWYENPAWQPHLIGSEILHDVELADLDADGDLDLVARNQYDSGNTLHLYRQDTPTSWSYRAVGIADGEGLVLADLDRDGDQDVVINGSWCENTKDILNGPWTPHPYATGWTYPDVYIATGDINGDGRVDIVLAPSEPAGYTYRLSWFEAPANPTSGDWAEHFVEDSVETVLHFAGAADFDKDGTVDIAVAKMQQGTDPDDITVYLNATGDGSTWDPKVLANTGSHSMRILDVDNDGDMDLYGANWQGDQVELWVNETDARNPGTADLDSWTRHVVDADKPWQSVFITASDIDGDGRQDIVAGAWWYRNPGTPSGNWVRNEVGDPLKNMAAVYDFDGDGKPDILGTQGVGSNAEARFVWAHNMGAGVFEVLDNVETGRGDFLQGAAVDSVATGAQLGVVLSWHAADAGIQTLSVPPDPLTATWTWQQISVTSQDEALSSGDIDRDGDIDLLLGTIWIENQGGTWVKHTLHDTNGAPYGESDPDRNGLADINGDGRLDAVVGYEAVSVYGRVAWYEQGVNAEASWTEHPIATVVGPMSLDVADMDGDGDLDVVVGEHNLDDPASAKLYVFENADGHGGQWRQHLVHTGDEHHDGAQAVDIDGDGDLDIISLGWGHTNVLVYENKTAR
jgi:hypothetical protein